MLCASVSGNLHSKVNEDLEDSPELVNEAPFEGGWIAKIKLAEDSNLDHLMSADAYQETIED